MGLGNFFDFADIFGHFWTFGLLGLAGMAVRLGWRAGRDFFDFSPIFPHFLPFGLAGGLVGVGMGIVGGWLGIMLGSGYRGWQGAGVINNCRGGVVAGSGGDGCAPLRGAGAGGRCCGQRCLTPRVRFFALLRMTVGLEGAGIFRGLQLGVVVVAGVGAHGCAPLRGAGGWGRCCGQRCLPPRVRFFALLRMTVGLVRMTVRPEGAGIFRGLLLGVGRGCRGGGDAPTLTLPRRGREFFRG